MKAPLDRGRRRIARVVCNSSGLQSNLDKVAQPLKEAEEEEEEGSALGVASCQLPHSHRMAAEPSSNQ